MKYYFVAPIITKNEMCDAMDNAEINTSSIKQVFQIAHNANKVTLSSKKIDDHSQLTCPTMHSQCQNTDINIESTSEIESRNGNNAEITMMIMCLQKINHCACYQ